MKLQKVKIIQRKLHGSLPAVIANSKSSFSSASNRGASQPYRLEQTAARLRSVTHQQAALQSKVQQRESIWAQRGWTSKSRPEIRISLFRDVTLAQERARSPEASENNPVTRQRRSRGLEESRAELQWRPRQRCPRRQSQLSARPGSQDLYLGPSHSKWRSHF